MDRQYIRDNLVIERYLQGRLTADEVSRVRGGLPRRRRALTRAQDGRFAAARARSSRRCAAQRATAKRRLRSAAAPRYALAASLVAGIALTFSSYLFVENRELRSENIAPARVLPLLTVRGANPNSIEAATTNDRTVLLLDPGFTPYDRYRATVVRRSDTAATELLSVDGLTPSYEGQLGVTLPSRLLTPGDYEVVLAGRMRDWPEQRASDDLGTTAFTVTAPR